MRSTILGLFFGLLLAFGLSLVMQSDNAFAANGLNNQTAGSNQQAEQNLTVFTSPTGQQITMVDLKRRVMAVYHVNAKSGQIELKSVRNVRWDFELEDFNGSIPKPSEIRTMAQNR